MYSVGMIYATKQSYFLAVGPDTLLGKAGEGLAEGQPQRARPLVSPEGSVGELCQPGGIARAELDEKVAGYLVPSEDGRLCPAEPIHSEDFDPLAVDVKLTSSARRRLRARPLSVRQGRLRLQTGTGRHF